ncbi:hypothetical protein [Arthrobacter sp. NPDC090010]|uniref:hypothetical protein n=1 Tax=Arthrobacter sp. NPDC090010 TaxID=3363942 RepID=UPI0037FE9253
MTNETNKSVERRRVLRGAAWATPVVAAAVAAPAAVASGTPTCPTCLKAGTLLGGVTTSQAIVAGNTGALAFAGVFGLDSSNCDLSLFQPLYTSVVTSATLTMSDGSTHTGTGLGTATGTFGQIGALPGTWLFSGIHFPSGAYILNSNPVRPTSITATVNVILIGLPSLIQITCPVTLTWNLNLFAVGAVTAPILGGAGTLNYTGTATPVP